MADRLLPFIIAGDGRAVNEGPPFFGVLEIALRFENPKGSENGGVRDRRRLWQSLHNFGNRRAALLPEDLHQTQLSVGKMHGTLASHGSSVRPNGPRVNRKINSLIVSGRAPRAFDRSGDRSVLLTIVVATNKMYTDEASSTG